MPNTEKTIIITLALVCVSQTQMIHVRLTNSAIVASPMTAVVHAGPLHILVYFWLVKNPFKWFLLMVTSVSCEWILCYDSCFCFCLYYNSILSFRYRCLILLKRIGHLVWCILFCICIFFTINFLNPNFCHSAHTLLLFRDSQLLIARTSNNFSILTTAPTRPWYWWNLAVQHAESPDKELRPLSSNKYSPT